MRLINKVDDVTYPLSKVNDDTYLVGINYKFEVRSFDTDDLLFDTKLDECNFKILSNKIYFIFQNRIFVYDVDLRKYASFYESNVGKEIWFFSESYVFETIRTEVRREYQYSLKRVSNKEIIWSEKSMLRPSVVSSQDLFFTDILGSVFSKKVLNSGDTIWTIDFSNNKLNPKVKLIKDILVFETSNQDLIGVESQTGKELWRLSNSNLHLQQQPNTNHLVGLSSNSFGDNFYQVIDPISGKKIVDKKFENFFYETTPNLACITETHYYFISNVLGDGTGTKSERITHLGCINLQTHEIEWIEKIGTTSERRNGYLKPEVHNNKFYLLDGDETLHIYELEK
jgi:hypothetical protein